MRVTSRTVHNMTRRLGIPHVIQGNRFIFDLQSPGDFFNSIKEAIRNPAVKPMYSVSELARLMNRHHDTVYRLLIENDIRTVALGTTRLVLVTELVKLRQNRELSNNSRVGYERSK